MKLTERSEMAQALNCEGRAVFTFDLDKHSETFAPYEAGSGCRHLEKSRYGSYMARGRISRDYEVKGDGIWYISGKCAVLKSQYFLEDYLEDAKNANTPEINLDTKIAVLVFSRKENTYEVHTLRVASKVIDTMCAVWCMLEEE